MALLVSTVDLVGEYYMCSRQTWFTHEWFDIDLLAHMHRDHESLVQQSRPKQRDESMVLGERKRQQHLKTTAEDNSQRCCR